MEGTKTWNELWIEMGYKQAKMCNENSPSYINCLVTGAGMRMVLVTVYNILVATKRVQRIEYLDLEEKNLLWEQTKELANNTLNLQETIKLSRCFYAIEYLLTQPI